MLTSLWHLPIYALIFGGIALLFVGSVVVSVVARLIWFAQHKKAVSALARAYSGPTTPSPWKGKTFLVFVNPVGGNRLGTFMFDNVVKPMMTKAGINVKGIFTTHAEHASEYLQSESLENVDAILSLSGDGMIHQLLNGLAKRREVTSKAELQKLLQRYPLAVIPVGTCNGISMSLYASVDPYQVTKKIIESSKKSIDVCHVVFDGKELYDLHAITWAVTADFDDIVENRLRWVGGLFRSAVTFWASMFLISRAATYDGCIRLKPRPVSAELTAKFGYKNPEELPCDEKDPSIRIIEGPITIFAAINFTHGAYDCIFSLGAVPAEGTWDMVVAKNCSRLGLLKVFLGLEDGSHTKFKDVMLYKTDWFEMIPKNQSNPGVFDTSGECRRFPSKVTVSVHSGMGSWIY